MFSLFKGLFAPRPAVQLVSQIVRIFQGRTSAHSGCALLRCTALGRGCQHNTTASINNSNSSFPFQTPQFCLGDFSNLFSSKPRPPIFTRNETFYEYKGLLRGFGTMRLPVTFIKKFLAKILNCFTSKIFVSPVGENGFRVLCVSLGVFFGTVKLTKF